MLGAEVIHPYLSTIGFFLHSLKDGSFGAMRMCA